MTTPHDSSTVPLPLEQYARAFDDLFRTQIQRRRFREYLAGLLLPRARNKTLTALVGAEPITQAQTAPVQQLQFFLTEAAWDAEAVTQRRIEVLRDDPLTTPHAQGALVIDETGDRKDGTHTAHVGYQYLGSIGKIANGIVAVTSLWADERVYYPLHVRPYTPAARLVGGKQDAAFRSKPQLALELVVAARAAGIPFRAVVADSLYGEHPEFTATLWRAGVPLVLAVKPSRIVWTVPPEPGSPWEAADRLRWGTRQSAQHPGAWTAVVRRFHDGHEETWWAVDVRLGGTYGPERSYRLVVATSDPRTLPKASTWYLVTNLPLPGTAWATQHPALPVADLAEVVRLYGLRQWVEQGYKQVKQELGWADFEVRSDRAIRRHWALVCGAFCFCWWAASRSDRPPPHPVQAPLPPEAGVGEKWGSAAVAALVGRDRQLLAAAIQPAIPAAVLAPSPPAGTELA
jgi:SRSO17 transposase